MAEEVQAKESDVTDAAKEEYRSQDWQRLSPIAILYFASSVIKQLIGDVIYLAPAIIIGYSTIKENPTFWLPIILIIISSLIAYAVLNFYFYQYRLHQGHIEIRSGVISKTHINLPFSRVQNIKLEQPIYYRLTGYACLLLETAGSVKQEAKVVALPLAYAEQLKLEILSQHDSQHSSLHNSQHNIDTNKEGVDTDSSTMVEANNTSEVLLNKRSISDLVIHGITSNRIWIIMGGLAPFYNKIAGNVAGFLSGYGIDLKSLFSLTEQTWWQITLYALSLTMLAMFILTSLSVLGSIVTFYGFTLTRQNNNFIRRSGLFTKHEVNMKLSRLQSIVRKQDWLDLLLKRINLTFEQSNAGLQNVAVSAANGKIMVPSVKPDECQFLVDEVYPNNKLATLRFNPISKRFIFRKIYWRLLPIFVLLAGVFIAKDKFDLAMLLIIPLLFFIALICLRWYRWGYAIDDNYIYVRNGYIGFDIKCFPIYKIQQCQFKQSIFMKRRKLCSIKLVLASGAITIPFIKEKDGLALINQSLFQVESTRRSWM